MRFDNRLLKSHGLRLRASLYCRLAGRWESGRYPSTNRGWAQWCLFQACHSSHHFRAQIRSC